MCRYDGDDYEWYVGAEIGNHVSDNDRTCEDCGRVIPAGEPHTRFTAERVDWDDQPHVFVAYVPCATPGASRFWMPGLHTHRINEDDIELWEALGFLVDEVAEAELSPQPPEYHWSCNHCRTANIWLEEVCDQHVVLVTAIDIPEHRYEYTDEQLGADFVTLDTLCRQRWQSKLTGDLIPVPVIERLARNAAEHALRGGLVA